MDRATFLTTAGAFVVGSHGGRFLVGRRGRPRVARVRPPVETPLPYYAYEGAPREQNQNYFNYFYSRGYRMTSLSVYGGVASPLYACVWVQQEGSPFSAISGTNLSGYLSWLQYNAQFGYVPSLLSITGDANDQVVTGAIEAGNASEYYIYAGIAANAFLSYDAQFRARGLALRTATIYGTKAAPLYAGVWIDDGEVAPGLTRVADSAATLTAAIAGEKARGYRPVSVTLTDDQTYLSAYRSDYAGAWAEAHNLTPAAYKSLEKSYASAGYTPISLHGGGTGANARYAAVFVKSDEAVPAARR